MRSILTRCAWLNSTFLGTALTLGASASATMQNFIGFKERQPTEHSKKIERGWILVRCLRLAPIAAAWCVGKSSGSVAPATFDDSGLLQDFCSAGTLDTCKFQCISRTTALARDVNLPVRLLDPSARESRPPMWYRVLE